MPKKFLRLILPIIIFSLFYLSFPTPAFAQSVWIDECIEGDVATIKGFGCLFQNTLSVVLRLVGIATFIMIVVGGFKYLTAGSDAKATESAQKTITMGIIGLIMVIGAYIILFLISEFTGINLNEFTVGLPD